MKGFGALSRAMALGFLRDKLSVFFAILFPLMFLVLFGGVFTDQGQSRSDILVVGDSQLIDQATAASDELDDVLSTEQASDLDAALAELRDGDVDGVVTEQGGDLVLHYSQADQVQAATLRGVFESIVQTANVQATGEPPQFTLTAEQVEDDSLEQIQYVTPSLLGWAVAMGATFGAAATLTAWRKNGLLRRLRLAPVPTTAVVLARVVVSLGVAAVQAAIFVGAGVLFFGLQLSSTAYLAVPVLVLGTFAFMAIGLLAGSVARTEEGAVGLANFIVLPMAFLSGSFIPLDGAPAWINAVSQALPLRHLNDGMLDVMVRGQGVEAILLPCGILIAFTVVLTAISARLFRWDA